MELNDPLLQELRRLSDFHFSKGQYVTTVDAMERAIDEITGLQKRNKALIRCVRGEHQTDYDVDPHCVVCGEEVR